MVVVNVVVAKVAVRFRVEHLVIVEIVPVVHNISVLDFTAFEQVNGKEEIAEWAHHFLGRGNNFLSP